MAHLPSQQSLADLGQNKIWDSNLIVHPGRWSGDPCICAWGGPGHRCVVVHTLALVDGVSFGCVLDEANLILYRSRHEYSRAFTSGSSKSNQFWNCFYNQYPPPPPPPRPSNTHKVHAHVHTQKKTALNSRYTNNICVANDTSPVMIDGSIGGIHGCMLDPSNSTLMVDVAHLEDNMYVFFPPHHSSTLIQRVCIGESCDVGQLIATSY